VTVVKTYKIRKYRVGDGRHEFAIRLPLEWIYNAKFPDKAKVIVEGDKITILPA